MEKTKQETAREVVALHDAAENAPTAESLRLEMQAANLQAALLTGYSTTTRQLWKGATDGND